MLRHSFSKMTLLAPAVALAAACGRSEAPRMDDALRNDLSLATQAQGYRPQQYVSPQELGYGQAPYGQPGYAPNGYASQPVQGGYYANGAYMAPAPAPAPVVRERVVYRDRPATRRSSGGGYARASTAGTYSVDAGAERRREQRAQNRKQGAIVGSVAGAAIGVATAKRSDRLKGGLIGAVAGGVLGGVIGNNQKTP